MVRGGVLTMGIRRVAMSVCHVLVNDYAGHSEHSNHGGRQLGYRHRQDSA